MTFTYDDYANKFLLFPVLCILFLIPIFISSLRNFIRSLTHTSCLKENYKEIIKYGFASILVLFLAGVNVKTLCSGGGCLFVEDETSVVETSGMISHIERVGKHEYQIILENTTYLIIDIGEYSEGDYVQISYLPKSGYVLSIQEESENPGYR